MAILRVRPLGPGDIGDIVRVENESWSPELAAGRETLLERLQRFPVGFLGCYVDDKLAGMTFGQPISEVKKTWYDNSCKEAFNTNGKIFYIVNVGVSEKYRSMGVGTKLLWENKVFAKAKNFQSIVLGARNIPSNIAFYTRNDFNQVEVVEGYLSDDVEAKGVGVIMEYLPY